MFLLTNIKSKKPIKIKKKCNRTLLMAGRKVAQEHVAPVQYFAFEGDEIRPESFIPLQTFTFELERPSENFVQQDSSAAQDPPKKQHWPKREVLIESQVLPPLKKDARKPCDFYDLETMFSEDVLREAASYKGEVDPSLSKYKNVVFRSIANSLLSQLRGEPKCPIRSLKRCVDMRTELGRDRVLVLLLVLLLMLNDWELQICEIPLKTKRLKALLLAIGCKVSKGVATLAKAPQGAVRKRLLTR